MRRPFVAAACCSTLLACIDGSGGNEACASDPPTADALRAGSWDPRFLLPGANGDSPAVFTTGLGVDGALYAGGIFTFAGSVSARNVARCFFFQAEDGIRDGTVTGVQTCALPI